MQPELPTWVNSMKQTFCSTVLHKKLLVHPCIIDGHITFVYEKGLQQNAPEFYERLCSFAEKNGLKLKEDQRSSFKRVTVERRSNIMPMMLLSASLLMHNVHADMTEHDNAVIFSEVVPQVQLDDTQLNYQREFSSEQELIENLFSWIQEHSSFSFEPEQVPGLKFVSAHEMLNTAFGKNVPKAINQESFELLGLYNYEEKVIYLLDSVDLSTEQGKGILLHELVHFLQYQNGQDGNVRCRNELESLAYRLEARYLNEHSHSPGFSPQQIKSLSSCS